LLICLLASESDQIVFKYDKLFTSLINIMNKTKSERPREWYE